VDLEPNHPNESPTGDSVDSGRSWVVAVAAAASMFAVFGVAYSFGAFFRAMSDDFGSSSSATALVFSLTISFSFLAGLWTGRWADRVGPRPVVLAGAASLVVGLVATTLVPNIWLGYLTYGGGVGFAVACGYVPMVACVGGWFDKRRASALGVAVAGIGAGTLIASPVAAWLIDLTSWRTTYLIFAAVAGSVMVCVAVVAKAGPAAVPSPTPKSIRQLMANWDFTILYASTVLIAMGLFVPFVFLADYAESQGVARVAAAGLVGLIGGASVVSRLGLGSLADRIGAIKLYVGSFFLMAAGHLIWLAAGGSYPILVLYTIVLGIGYGGFIALSPEVVAQRFGLDGLGGTIGTLYTAAGIGSLAGPPFAGFLIDGFSYNVAIGFSAVTAALAAAILTLLGRGKSTGSTGHNIPAKSGSDLGA